MSNKNNKSINKIDRKDIRVTWVGYRPSVIKDKKKDAKKYIARGNNNKY